MAFFNFSFFFLNLGDKDALRGKTMFDSIKIIVNNKFYRTKKDQKAKTK